jgi:CheY-like chemotaxis protein
MPRAVQRTSTPTVLVIDDAEATRRGIVELLRIRGYAALEARNGAEGLQCLRENPHVCAVVLDLTMPGTDGVWFRSHQLRDPQVADISVVVFTGLQRAAEAHPALRGCEVLVKPFSVDRLFDVIRRCCGLD